MEVKSAAFVISNISPFPDVITPYYIDANTLVRTGSLKDILDPADNKIWREWLGSLHWETNIEHKTTHIITWQESSTVDVIDQENINLESKLHGIYHSLILTAPFRCEGKDASILSGKAIISGGNITLKSIRQVGRTKALISPSYYREKDFFKWMLLNLKNPHRLQEWKDNWLAYESALNQKDKTFLIQLAQLAFRKGCHQLFNDFRFPNFVRAIETIIALRKGLGPADFSSRTQSLLPPGYTFQFGVTPTDLDQILKDAYQLRSDCVHGKPFADTLRLKLGTNFALELPKYEYVIETCARLVLQKALADTKVLSASDSRSNLETAWNSGTLP